MATFGYGRVSTLDQTAENQRQELESQGFALDYWFADTVSGGREAGKRAQFGVLLDRIRKGETLVVSKLDRLGRNALDVVKTVRDLEERGVKVVVAQLGSTDLTSVAGKLIVTVLAAVAEMERGLIIERTQAGLARARREGVKFGRPPKLSDKAWAAVGERLRAGESPSALAREYRVSRAAIHKRFRRVS